jgi:hypothetical protein
MKNQVDKIIDRKKYVLINHGAIIIFLISVVTFFLLYLLKIDDKSVIEMVLDYYFK